MIRGTRNQIANARSNPYQSTRTKALCVCSAGLLRSPTIAEYLSRVHKYNTRAVGTEADYALIPLSDALVYWADEIYVVKDKAHKIYQALEELKLEKPVYVLNIPDSFDTFSDSLYEEIEKRIINIMKMKEEQVGITKY